jgi:hypothetical protein
MCLDTLLEDPMTQEMFLRFFVECWLSASSLMLSLGLFRMHTNKERHTKPVLAYASNTSPVLFSLEQLQILKSRQMHQETNSQDKFLLYTRASAMDAFMIELINSNPGNSSKTLLIWCDNAKVFSQSHSSPIPGVSSSSVVDPSPSRWASSGSSSEGSNTGHRRSRLT